MSIKEISENVTSDIKHLKEEHITEDGLQFGGEGLKVELSPKNETVLSAKVDMSNAEAVKSLEKLISNLTGSKYKLPKAKGEVTVSVVKTAEGHEIKVGK